MRLWFFGQFPRKSSNSPGLDGMTIWQLLPLIFKAFATRRTAVHITLHFNDSSRSDYSQDIDWHAVKAAFETLPLVCTIEAHLWLSRRGELGYEEALENAQQQLHDIFGHLRSATVFYD